MSSSPAFKSRSSPYKIVVLGSGGVGKSSLTLRFSLNTFSPDYLPTIEDCYRKQALIDNESAFLDILDTAGQEEYSALRDQWVREGQAFLLVFSVANRNSFNELSTFRERILLVNEDQQLKGGSIPMVLVANKCDIVAQREVSLEEIKEKAKEFDNIPYFETSAKEAQGVEEVFFQTVREIRKWEERVEEKNKKNAGTSKKTKKSWCSIL